MRPSMKVSLRDERFSINCVAAAVMLPFGVTSRAKYGAPW